MGWVGGVVYACAGQHSRRQGAMPPGPPMLACVGPGPLDEQVHLAQPPHGRPAQRAGRSRVHSRRSKGAPGPTCKFVGPLARTALRPLLQRQQVGALGWPGWLEGCPGEARQLPHLSLPVVNCRKARFCSRLSPCSTSQNQRTTWLSLQGPRGDSSASKGLIVATREGSARLLAPVAGTAPTSRASVSLGDLRHGQQPLCLVPKSSRNSATATGTSTRQRPHPAPNQGHTSFPLPRRPTWCSRLHTWRRPAAPRSPDAAARR